MCPINGIHFPKRLSRREFLRLVTAAGAAPLASFLQACRGAKTPTPTWAPTNTRASLPTDTPTPTWSPTAIQPTGTQTPTPLPTVTTTSTATLFPTNTPTLSPTATPPPLAAGLETLDFTAFLDESARRIFLRDPESITINGLAKQLGVRENQLTNVSDAFIRETQQLQRDILDLLRTYDPAQFTPEQELNATIYEWSLDDVVRGFPFLYNDYLVTPFLNSLNWFLQYLFTEAHSLDSVQDAQDYISRLQQVHTKYEQVLDGLKRREAFGVILPQFLIPDLLDNLKQYTGFIDSHPYYIPFLRKVSKIAGLSASEKQSMQNQAKQAIKESVAPGYQLIIDYFNDLRPIAPQEVGIWRFSNGVEYYAHLLRHYTTTERTAEEIHQLGLEHVARIVAEMREAFGKLGYPSGDSLETLVNRLGEEDGYVSFDTAEAAFKAAIDQGVGMLDKVMDIPLSQPIAVVGGEVGNYCVPPAQDGSRPPVFYAATAYVQPKFRIKSIAFHEAVPGHGYQADVAWQQKLPLFRNAFQYDAYVEGWALYAERLMWELGVYQEDQPGNIGRLWMELLRAVRCVLDTGIHAKKWTFNQSIQYNIETMGSRGDGEVRRYIMLPGQAISYYVGFLKILELRQAAKERLGSRFDLKKFHHVLLGSGHVPLAVLEQLVEGYITNTLK